jgi:16S rRNA (adenine1518-N6/adenine1519-N6)-dimethyltransferase
MLATVPPRCFEPPPRVFSAVLRLTLREPTGQDEGLAAALRLAAEGFCHRRKKLVNALIAADPDGALREALQALGLQDARPQDLTLGDWLGLVRRAALHGQGVA